MNPPIKYTIENIDGKHYVSDSFEVNHKINMIRIKTLHITELNDINDRRPET